MDFEVLGVSAVQEIIAKTDYLEPYIPTKDREPSWDGNVYVYHHAISPHSKDDLYKRVPVQVKGMGVDEPCKESISYSVEIADLKNYFNDGGAIYFVVCFDKKGNNKHIYYISLLPYDLKKIISCAGQSETKVLCLKPCSDNPDDFTNLFFNFIRDANMQRAYVQNPNISLADLISEGATSELTFGYTSIKKEDTNPFNYLLNNDIYLYMETPQGISFPIQHIEKIDVAIVGVNGNVMVKDTVFYNTYQMAYKLNEEVYHIGKSNSYFINHDETKAHLNYTPKGNLNERIKDIEFLKAAISAGGFSIGGIYFQLEQPNINIQNALNIDKVNEYLKTLLHIKSIMDKLCVNVALELDKITSNDVKRLYNLDEALKNNGSIYLGNDAQEVGFYPIANLNILLRCKKTEDEGKYTIVDFWTSTRTYNRIEDSKEYVIPYYMTMGHDAILKCSNFNARFIEDNLQTMDFTVAISEWLNQFIVELLLAADSECEKENIYLDLANSAVNAISSRDKYTPEAINTVNELQIIKRRRNLSFSEKHRLMKITEEFSDEEEILTGVFLLLDEQSEAQSHYLKMDTEEQQYFSKLPIYRFWKATSSLTEKASGANGGTENGQT